MNTSSQEMTMARNGLSARQAVEFIAQTIEPGYSERGVCPKCGGGVSNEKSFVCSRDARGVAYYRCFRGKCGFNGRVLLSPGAGGEQEPRKRRIHEFNRPLEDLDANQMAFFRNTYGINPANDIFWCPSLGAFAHVVFGPLGQRRGWVVRGYGPDRKDISYPSRDEEFIGWHYPPHHMATDSGAPKPRTEVVVVEDWLSGRKVADSGYIGISLFGTTINTERCYEIREVSASIRLALDKGMLGHMIKLRERFGPIFDDIIIWQLDKDLKYVSRKRIIEAVNGRTDFITNPDGP